MKHYPPQDPVALDKAGNYYVRHIQAMTAEGLHGKFEIAEQLGWRDMLIDQLRAELARASSERDDWQKRYLFRDQHMRAQYDREHGGPTNG